MGARTDTVFCLRAPAAVLLQTEVTFCIFEDWNFTASVEAVVAAKILICVFS